MIYISEIVRSSDQFICGLFSKGPPITIRKSGSHTHSSRYDTTISGHYRFTESKTVDFGDYKTKWVTKREDLIFKLDDGSARNIFRSMVCDEELSWSL